MTLTRLQLNEIIRIKTRWTTPQARHMVNMVLETITDTLARGDDVHLNGFGTFRVDRRLWKSGRLIPRPKGKVGCNKGMKSVRLPPRWIAVVRFKMSKQMTRRVRSLIPQKSPVGDVSK
ncbi:MAG TPA: HU family DNA-binding protein [Terracidiphilus sp.]|nr:HU family DNA-binding protein [Terracidiphilus sp.]